MENRLNQLWQASLAKEAEVKKEMLVRMPEHIDEQIFLN